MPKNEHRCPVCNAVIPEGAKKCPSCGRLVFTDDETYLDVIDRLENLPKESRKKEPRKVVPPEHRIAAISIWLNGFIFLVTFSLLLPYDVVLATYLLIIGLLSLWAGIATFIGHPKGPAATVIMGVLGIFTPNAWFLPVLLGSIAIAGIAVPWLFNFFSKKKV